MSIYRGISGANREIKEQWRGIGGTNRKISEQWRGISGTNRKVFTSGNPPIASGSFGELGYFQVLSDRVKIHIGSNITGTDINGAAHFNYNITSGSTITLDWACTERTGASYYLQAFGNVGGTYDYTRVTLSTFARTTNSFTATHNSSWFEIIASRTGPGSTNQAMTIEIYNVKVNGVQVFPE